MLYELARNLDEIIDALVTLLADQPLIVTGSTDSGARRDRNNGT